VGVVKSLSATVLSWIVVGVIVAFLLLVYLSYNVTMG
jgi:hypothetical protein